MKNFGTIVYHFKLSKTDWKAQRQLNLIQLAMTKAFMDAVKKDSELKGLDMATKGISAVQGLSK